MITSETVKTQSLTFGMERISGYDFLRITLQLRITCQTPVELVCILERSLLVDDLKFVDLKQGTSLNAITTLRIDRVELNSEQSMQSTANAENQSRHHRDCC